MKITGVFMFCIFVLFPDGIAGSKIVCPPPVSPLAKWTINWRKWTSRYRVNPF
jgi:hypothetical protein